MAPFMLFALLFTDDPSGWSKAKWGMTEEQLESAMPTAVRLEKPETLYKNDEWIGTHRVDPIVIADRRFSTTLWFSTKTKLLARVSLSMPIGEPDAQDFQAIESALVNKYGNPWHSDTGKIRQSQWSFHHTVITLKFINTMPSIRMLHILYEQRDPSKLD